MQTERQSYFGQGGKIVRPAILMAGVGGLAAWFQPDIFWLEPRLLQPLRGLLGSMCILAGVWLFSWGGLRMVQAVKQDRLETGGPFALVRHSMYAAWIVFLFPGIALVSGAWLVASASLAAWVCFRKWSVTEEQALINRFGQQYEVYRRNVPALFPFPQ